MPTFNPPTWNATPSVTSNPVERKKNPQGFRLMDHYSARATGQSVLKIAGEYVTVSSPTSAQIAAATEVYMGGHVYEVTEAVAAALTAAGYEENLS